MAILIKTICAGLALLLALPFSAPASAGENFQLVEQEIKAGLLYNFLKYTQWPQDRTNGTAVVCLLGGDPFDGHLQPMAGRTVNQHGIELRSVHTAREAEACSLLYVNASEKPDWPMLQRTLTGKSVLTVSDFDGFAQSGGMIEFTRIDKRIGVKINVDAVTAAHLTVQDRLLHLASTVHSLRAD
ncbi:MAG TPA: YfiR family protein [Rhizomicrobium sp.]|nr:YfiR family protein [Rhizomicrobium sp.]